MTNWEHMTELVGEIPDLRGARCKGMAQLYEQTIATNRDGGPTREETDAARETALRICAACPSLAPCRAYIAALPKSRRPLGVVAGQVIGSTGRSLRTRTPRTAGADATDQATR
ncbi:hypothetical protein MINTM018_48040 [Mycobacterium intracellulare]|uniref:4Fe-4S Wbl-type domain-containing protein n=1 Tax=Mycobacterium intracellulare TaxID=1767 RepID=A0A7R7RPY4_MYCIT|nr:hypothetical protein MINTM018_48040 [Mycobacterium intracellulare]